jgi:hypothetical protein
MLSELASALLLPVTGPFKGTHWVLKQIQEQVDEELYSEASLRAQLVRLNEQLDNGEISEPDFEEREAELLDLLSALEEPEADVDE